VGVVRLSAHERYSRQQPERRTEEAIQTGGSRYLSPYFAQVGMDMRISSDASKIRTQLQTILENLGQSYLILCAVLDMFDQLIASKFCGTFYSILIQRREPRIAELVPIQHSSVEQMKVGLEVVIGNIAGNAVSVEQLQVELAECVVEPACALLRSIRFPTTIDLSRSWALALVLCRMTSMLLDLALVTYVGSHVSRFE
jgi:hypothetical protein